MTVPPTPQATSRTGSKNFTDAEIDRLLLIAERIIPRGQYQWDEVARHWNEGQRAEVQREREALRTKFNRLRSSKKQGDHGVAKAKEIQELIEASAKVHLGRDCQKLNDEQLGSLLNQVELLMPGTDEDWEAVAQIFQIDQGFEYSAAALKHEFNALFRVPKPTGDPSCPPLVARAKRIYWQLLAQTNGNVSSDEEDNNEDNDDEDNDQNSQTGEAATVATRILPGTATFAVRNPPSSSASSPTIDATRKRAREVTSNGKLPPRLAGLTIPTGMESPISQTAKRRIKVDEAIEKLANPEPMQIDLSEMFRLQMEKESAIRVAENERREFERKVENELRENQRKEENERREADRRDEVTRREQDRKDMAAERQHDREMQRELLLAMFGKK